MNGERTVVILGAGASHSFEGGRFKLPLQRDFFSDLFKPPPLITGHYYHIEFYLKHKYGKDISFLTTNPFTIEQFLIEIDSLSENELHGFLKGKEYSDNGFFPVTGKPIPKPKEFSQGIRSEAARLVRYVINRALIGPNQICPIHLKLVSFLEPGDTIISFNYDTLIDKCLMTRRPLWKMASGYGLLVKAIITDYPNNDIYLDCSPSKILLLKPHGSLSWSRPFTDLDEQEPFDISTHQQSSVSFPLTENGKKVKDFIYAIGETRVQIGDLGGYIYKEQNEEKKLTPGFIIPPFPHKNISSLVFNHIWRIAKAALKDTQNIISIGYSLPEADKHVFKLFQESSPIPGEKKVILVDPAAEAQEYKSRFSRAFNLKSIDDVTVGALCFKDFVKNYCN